MEITRTTPGVRARHIVALALTALAVGALAGPAQARRYQPPSPGAPGVGDRLFPGLGNGGYDAKHYRLALTYPTSAPQQDVNGRVTMVARATQSLSSFNLDYADGTVSDVEVNGRDAAYVLEGEELVITPGRAIRKGRRFVVMVDFVGGPDVPVDELPFGWFTTVDGSVTAGQPDRGHWIYPVNDHPVDKATYTIKLDVPEGVTAVASGVLRWSRTDAGRTVSLYVMDEPMASELTQIAVGDLSVIDRGRASGVDLRDVVANACAEQAEPSLAKTPDHMRWMVDRVGRYPFDNYGLLVANQTFQYALETQTLSLTPCLVYDPEQIPPELVEVVNVHELAHQWFGDSVAPESWSDLWLNEGHATWYEWTYDDEFFGNELEPRLRAAYEQGDIWRTEFGPVALPASGDFDVLFSPNVYDGGAVVLYALRQVIGDETFRELERRWAQRYAGKSVGTDEFIAFASRVAHRDLHAFLGDWLYGAVTPPMPGHPDWTVTPVGDAPVTTARKGSAARRIERRLRRY
jgi:aminopeptidase N